jgi:hypothetical protein
MALQPFGLQAAVPVVAPRSLTGYIIIKESLPMIVSLLDCTEIPAFTHQQ